MSNYFLNNKKKYYLLILIVFSVINLPLLLNSSFISDDYSVIYLAQKNPFPVFTYYENGLEGLIKDFKPEAFKYRPLTSLSLYLNQLAAGLNSIGFHIISLALHILIFFILTEIILLLSLQVMKKAPGLLFFIPLLYLINPASANEVCWIATRSDILVVLFGVLSFYYTLKILDSEKKVFLLISTTYFVAALMSKENAIFIPFLEIFLLLQILFINKALIKNKKLLYLNSGIKIALIGIYFLIRNLLSSGLQLSDMKMIGLKEVIPVIIKTFLFILLPFDSGTFSFIGATNFPLAILISFICVSPIVILIILSIKNKEKSYLIHLASIFFIWLISISVFVLLGGISHRLLILTIAFSIPSIFLTTAAIKNSNKHFTKLPKYIFGFFVLFFLGGYIFISSEWVQNMKVMNESISSIEKDFMPENNYVFISYPHSIGQTYCFSDIGLALYYRKNHSIGNYPNITQGAAINSNCISGYNMEEDQINKVGEGQYEINSGVNCIYYTPGAYFTEDAKQGAEYDIKGKVKFLVENTGLRMKPVKIKLSFDQGKSNKVIYKFNKNKFEVL